MELSAYQNESPSSNSSSSSSLAPPSDDVPLVTAKVPYGHPPLVLSVGHSKGRSPMSPLSHTHAPQVDLCQATSSNVLCAERVANAWRDIRSIRQTLHEEFTQFDNQLAKFYWEHCQDENLYNCKMKIRSRVKALLRKHFPSCELYIVGSTVNGCGSNDSDMDLVFVVNEAHGRNVRKRSSVNGKLAHVAQALAGSDPSDFTDVEHVENAKIPIVRFTAVTSGRRMAVDLSLNNIGGIYNSHLLFHYARLDRRFPLLCLIVRAWAKSRKIADARFRTFNSYSLNLLVLHYLLYATDPPVMPNLQCLYYDFFHPARPFEELNASNKLPWAVPFHPNYDASPGALLLGFFHYFAEFDYCNFAVGIAHGGRVHRAYLPPAMFHDRHMCGYPIVIMDPYEPVNPARSVDDSTFPKIVEAFRATRDALFSFIAPFQDLRLNAALDEKAPATNGALRSDAEEGRKSAQNGGTSTDS